MKTVLKAGSLTLSNDKVMFSQFFKTLEVLYYQTVSVTAWFVSKTLYYNKKNIIYIRLKGEHLKTEKVCCSCIYLGSK